MALHLFTIVITLTEKWSYLFPLTLDSLMAQQGTVPFEVVVVDGTHQRALFHQVPKDTITILSAQSANPFAMLNQAVHVAKGQYIHCMAPGEFYISRKALSFMAKMVHAHEYPDLLYTGRIVRHNFGQPSVDIQPLELNDLKKAKIPLSLHPFWFRKESLLMLNGFNAKYEFQGGYDLVCRYFLAPPLRKAFVRRVLTDYEYRKLPTKQILHYSVEAFWISLIRFGFTRHLVAWLLQNCLRLILFSWKLMRTSFWKNQVAYE